MKLLLSGYYGFGNAGDEAILEAIIAGIRHHIPDAEVTVLSADPQGTSSEHGVEAADRWSLRQQFRALRSADLFIQGGGGLFQDTTSKLSALYYMNQLVLARMTRTPFVILAQGLGPLSSPFLRGSLARNFSRARLVTVRDEQSSQDLVTWGLRSPEPLVTADPVLLLQPAPPGRVQEFLSALDLSAGEYILVALRQWPDADSAYEAVVQWLNQQERPVLLLPFQYAHDLPIAQQILARLRPGLARIPDAPCRPREIMGLIQAAHEVLAMRLHALIMAAAVGTTSAGLSYDPKIDAFCQRSGQPVKNLHLLATRDIEALIQAADDGRHHTESNRVRLRQDAWRTFELLAEVCSRL